MADLLEAAGVGATADTALVTVAETVVALSDIVKPARKTGLALVFGWCELTTGANTTAVTPRIRRGATAAGVLVGEANAVSIPTAAGATDLYDIMVVDPFDNVNELQYVLTLQQTAASANGAALLATIVVLLLG